MTESSKPPRALEVTESQALADSEELPVVARLIVEVRSNGSRTVARGAMEDAATGTRAAIEASGSTPLELALGLAKSLLAAPWLTRRVSISGLRALLRK